MGGRRDLLRDVPGAGNLGGMHQDPRKIRELGDSYREFVAKTSFAPFAALLSGRARWTSDDMPWAAIGVGALLTAAIVALTRSSSAATRSVEIRFLTSPCEESHCEPRRAWGEVRRWASYLRFFLLLSCRTSFSAVRLDESSWCGIWRSSPRHAAQLLQSSPGQARLDWDASTVTGA